MSAKGTSERPNPVLQVDNWQEGEKRTLLNGAVTIERDHVGIWTAYITDHRDQYAVRSLLGPSEAFSRLVVSYSEQFSVPSFELERPHPEF